MQQKFEPAPEPSPDAQIQYYKSLAQLSEERAREIRRVAALERARLEARLLEQQPTLDAYAADLEWLRMQCERHKERSERFKERAERLKKELADTKARLKVLEQAQNRIAASRAHRIAEAYSRYVQTSSGPARALRWMRDVLLRLKHLRR